MTEVNRQVVLLCNTVALIQSYSIVRFVACKSEVADTVADMVQVIENWLNLKMQKMTCINRKSVKWICSNGGGEYVGNKF